MVDRTSFIVALKRCWSQVLAIEEQRGFIFEYQVSVLIKKEKEYASPSFLRFAGELLV
jgi:hypothetical protein